MNDIAVVDADFEIRINPDATFDDWKNMGYVLAKKTEGMCWAWGKWWETGHAKFNRQATEFVDNELQLARTTIKGYAIVWKAFPKVCVRTHNLSFSHHSKVVAMRSEPEKMNRWLRKAVQNKWPAKVLADKIQGRKRGKNQKVVLTSNVLDGLQKQIAHIIELLTGKYTTMLPQTLLLAEAKQLQEDLNKLKPSQETEKVKENDND